MDENLGKVLSTSVHLVAESLTEISTKGIQQIPPSSVAATPRLVREEPSSSFDKKRRVLQKKQPSPGKNVERNFQIIIIL
jgi:hypothetical protein